MHSKNKNSKLREWLIHLKLREWTTIMNLVNIKMVYLSPVSKEALTHIIKHHKRLKTLVLSNKREHEFEYDNYIKITRQKITYKEWNNIKSEIPKACLFYKKMLILKEGSSIMDLKMQHFFLENKMEKNLDSQHNYNEKNIRNKKINGYYQGAKIARNIELFISDIRNKNIRKNLLNLNDYQEAIDLFYYENTLRLLSEKHVRNSSKKIYTFSKKESNINSFIPEKIKKYPQIELFSKMHYIFSNESDNTFFNLKKILESDEIKNKFTLTYLNDLYSLLLGYCIIRMNKGENKFAAEYLFYLQKLADSNSLLEQGIMPIWQMKNALKVAMRIKDFAWARKFIDEQKEHLAEKEKQAIIDYCEGLLAFIEGDYDLAYTYMSSNPLSKDPMIKVDSLLLYIFILLELNYEDLFARSKENLRSMINSKTDINENFIHKWRITLNQITRVEKIAEWDEQKLKAVIQNIEKMEFFPGKTWLINYLNRKLKKASMPPH